MARVTEHRVPRFCFFEAINSANDSGAVQCHTGFAHTLNTFGYILTGYNIHSIPCFYCIEDVSVYVSSPVVITLIKQSWHQYTSNEHSSATQQQRHECRPIVCQPKNAMVATIVAPPAELSSGAWAQKHKVESNRSTGLYTRSWGTHYAQEPRILGFVAESRDSCGVAQ